MNKSWDVIIVGAGPAGLVAALYAGRAELKTLVIGFPLKSNISKAPKVFNYPGFSQGIPGKDLQKTLLEHAKKYKVSVLEEEVVSIKKDKLFEVKTVSSAFASRAVIIACGKSYSRTGIKGEKEFDGKGIHYCVVCDGYAYRGKKVGIVGNGNYAAEEALEMLSYTKDVSILLNGMKSEMSPHLGKVLGKKVSVIPEKITEFKGSKFLEKVAFGKKELPISGVFVAIGKASAASFANKLAIQVEGDNIKIDHEGKTSAEGVFAAGDCCGGNAQAVKSAGEGCNAALSAAKFLKGRVYIDYKES